MTACFNWSNTANSLIVIEQIEVNFSCVCPVISDEFRNNVVKVAVDPRGDSHVDLQTTLTML